MPASNFGDPTVIPSLIAHHIVKTSTGLTVTKDVLSAAIADVTVETQTAGAALLHLQLIDPDKRIERSGLCDVDEDGLLQQVDVNYPEGTEVWWRLAMVDFHDVDASSTQPNLVLSFQHRLVSWLQNDWGALSVKPGTTTRAQFIKQLVDRVPKVLKADVAGPSPGTLRFVCPELNVVQPIAGSGVTSAGTTTVATAQQVASVTAKVNKHQGVGHGANVTAKGSPLSAAQIAVVNTLLGVCSQHNAPTIVMEAMIFAGIMESNLNPADGNSGYAGVLAGSVSYYTSKYGSTSSPAATLAQATDFLVGTPGSGYRSALTYATQASDPGNLAAVVEQPDLGGQAISIGGGYGQYALETPGPSVVNQEAKAIVAAYGGGSIGSTSTTGATAAPKSDVSQLARGTADNPDEDSWTCVQRLAAEVNWSFFTSPSPAPGVWGNYIYYMDGPAVDKQKPSLYLKLSDDGATWSAVNSDTGKVIAADGVVTGMTGTVDNTAFQFQKTRKVKGKTQRSTRIRTPQTPTQIRFNMICGVMEFNAGDVFVIHNCGPRNGRWIVEDVVHNSLQDLFAQFTLGPPTAPLPEPAAVSTGNASAGQVASVTGGSIAGYVNPFGKTQGLSPERIDMGVDFAAPAGQPILAIGNAVIQQAASSGTGWSSPTNTQACVYYKLLDGPFAGKSVYVAEDIRPTVSTGQTVKAGDTIATFLSSGTGLETGWGSGTPFGALASALHQDAISTGQSSDPGSVASAAGADFNKLLVALGCKSGLPNTPSRGPGMPAGWPTIGSLTTAKVQKPKAAAPSAPASTVGTVVSGASSSLGGVFGSLFG